MNFLLGVLMVTYALGALVCYFVAPSAFSKLAKFKELYGVRKGYALHILFYVALPLGIGIYFLKLHDC